MIIKLEEAKYTLQNIRETVEDLGTALKTEELKSRIEELEATTTAENFWADQNESSKILKTLKILEDKLDAYNDLVKRLDDAEILADLAIEENDESITDEIIREVNELEAEENRQRIEVLLSDEYDSNNAILAFHPGAGGTEAQDWALMLYRMYVRWSEKHGYKVKTLDWLDGEEAGLKSATVLIEGLNAYGYLKGENGVHRLVRVSPFDSSGRRHTSFASVEVMPELDDIDDEIELRDDDLDISAHRSSGAGGQHVNKTDSAIRIVHKPTGIVVGCQNERSQLQNKETALKMLKSKLLEIKHRENLDKIEDIKGEKTNIEWGAQIRSYVFMPYTLVKDNRTGWEDGDVSAVMDGDIDDFINAYLKANA
jgi:peptide chain release factor 2